MKTFVKAAAIFLAVQAFSFVLAWLSGYDFDHRSKDVAFWVFCSVLFGGWASSVVWVLCE